MRTETAESFVRSYLESTRSRYALESSVLAAGERLGFSRRRLQRAARRLGVDMDTNSASWVLPALTGPAIEQLFPQMSAEAPALEVPAPGLA